MFSSITQNASLKLISLVITIVLWFVVLGSRNVEISKEIPLELITPIDLVAANDIPDKVTFRVSGPKAFLRNLINRKEEPIRVNLTSSKPGLVTYRFFSDNIQVPLGVKVLSINPTAIIVKLEYLKRKEIPIKLVTKGEVKSGSRIQRLALIQHSVKIRGAESRVDQVSEVPTLPVDLTQLHGTGEHEIPVDLTKIAGILLDGDLPKIRFDVIEATANFRIRNADIKVLTTRRFQIDPKEVTLLVRCNTEELKNLDRSKVFATVDVRTKTVGTYTVNLSVQLPSNIKLIKVLPSKAVVTLY